MAIITTSVIESETQLISGIPMSVVLSTNIPTIIFYTLDGSIPTISSLVYISSITLPSTSPVRLRTLAISGPDTGYLDVTYATDSSDLIISRRIVELGGGVVVDAYDVTNVLTDGYSVDADGNTVVPTRSSDYELVDLEIKYSSTGPDGLGPGTLLLMGAPPVTQLAKASAVDWTPTTPNHSNALFNPKSLYITMDWRDGYQDQIVSPHVIINRPWGDTRNSVKYLQGKEMYEPQPYISGGHVRTHYNYEKGIAVSYYFDHNETRWIKSIQSFDPTTIPRGIGMRRSIGPAIVFKWIYNKRSAI